MAVTIAGNPHRSFSHLPLAARSEGDVDETASVLLALVGAALGALGLLLLLDLGGLRLDLACYFARLAIVPPSLFGAKTSPGATHRHGRGIRELCPY